MKRAITLPNLKKYLKEMDRNDLEKLIYEMYKEYSTVQQIINVEFLGREYEVQLFEEYDKKLQKIFYPSNIVVTGFSPVAAKNVLKDFLSICKDEELKTKAKLNYVIYGVDLINTYGGANDKLYNHIIDYFYEVAEYASVNKEFFEENNAKMEEIVSVSNDFGYGIGDCLSDAYDTIVWVE